VSARGIFSDLSQAIGAGRLSPGQRLPTEAELMARYGCARATVSKAMQALADQGLIERRRRAGSFVAQPRPRAAVLRIPDLEAAVRLTGRPYRFELEERRLGAPERLPEPRPEGAKRALFLRGRHWAGETVFCVEDRQINLDAAPETAGVDFAERPPGAWLLAHTPWGEAEHRIGAMAVDGENARRLGLAAGSACLKLERRTWRSGVQVTAVRQLFPAEEFELLARFAPGEQN
jgi:GntR family transcriptional regulator, histidine utilization repressor